MRTLVWTREADLDVDDMIAFLRSRDPRAGARIATAALAQSNRLLDSPYLGQPDGDTGHRRLTIPRTPYRLIYEVGDTEVRIPRLWHGARG